MKAVKDMNLGELAAYICSHLETQGIICTLSGGACVSIYSENQYMSNDLDFIENGWNSRQTINDAMNLIGFVEQNRYYVHSESNYFVEFPKGPLSIGSEPILNISTLEFPTGVLRILSPTDCVKDRLAAYYFWDDLQSLEQARLVAQRHDVDFSDLERWSKTENNLKKYKVFIDKYSRQ